MAEKNLHPDQMYIDGLVQNNSSIIQSIYKKFVPKVTNYIRTNSGDDDQAQDVVQEVLITIYNQAKTKGLQLTCPFDAYFFLLCKRRWLNEIKKSSSKEVTLHDENVSIDESVQEMTFQTEVFDEKQSLFDEMFQKLGEKCQEVLKLSFITTRRKGTRHKMTKLELVISALMVFFSLRIRQKINFDLLYNSVYLQCNYFAFHKIIIAFQSPNPQ